MTISRVQIGFLIIGICVSLLVVISPQMPVATQLLFSGFAIAFFGLPHGAVDAFIAKRFAIWQTPSGFLAFLAFYLAIAGMVIIIWLMAPVFSLAAFFIISAWHFGADAKPQTPFERWIFGGMILSLPAFFAPEETMRIFAVLSGFQANMVLVVLKTAAPFLVLASFFFAVRHLLFHQATTDTFLAIVGLLIFAWILPPLIYFGVYFCALHSVRHFGNVIQLIPHSARNSAIRHVLSMTGLTLLFAGIFYIALAGQLSVEARMIKILFIGLAALTVPHMVLVDGFWKNRIGAPSSKI